MKDDLKKIKIFAFSIVILLIIGLVGGTMYYLSVKDKADNINIEAALEDLQEEEQKKEQEENQIQNRIDELKTGAIVTEEGKREANEKQDQINKFNEEKEKAEHKETYIYNTKMEDLDNDELSSLRKQARLYASQYNWSMLLELESTAATTYDFRENVEAYELLQDLGYLSNYHEAWEGQDEELLSGVHDPVLYAYGFFFKSLEFQAKLIKDKKSVLIYTGEEGPKLIGEEVVAPGQHNLSRYYAKLGEVKATIVSFEIDEGIIDFLLVNNYEGTIEPISITLRENNEGIDILTYEEYIKDKNLLFLE